MNNRMIAVGIVLLLAVALLLGLALNTKKKSTTLPHAIIQVTDKGFSPSVLLVKKGTTVDWKNIDPAPHRIKANPYPSGSSLPGLDSKFNLPENTTYSYTFEQPGNFEYHDQLHPLLNGTIKVTN